MSEDTENTPSERESFRDEFVRHWNAMPYKGVFFALFAAWALIFHFLGNSTLGYIDTRSLFVWLNWMWGNNQNDEHGLLIPFVVLVLFWWKRDELLEIKKRNWWPGLALVILGILLHLLGYFGQQTQISVIGFFAGLYGLTGLIWGPRWLIASFFPFCLFTFCLPMDNVLTPLTFPLRQFATMVTGVVCQTGLGIDVVVQGTQIYEPNGTYHYEVAAACSGIRSLIAMIAMSTIYAFVMFKSPWRRMLILPLSVPLAVAANVFRLTSIVVAAETFGQSAGNYMHDSGWLSMLPYLPAITGLLLVGFLLRENRGKKKVVDLEPAADAMAK